MTVAGAVAPSSGSGGLARSMAGMSLLTALSRATGFVRIVVVAAVVGTTYLGNVYQSANGVPNLVFELFVAGTVQAVLIPSLVERLDRGAKGDAEHVAGAVLGLTTALLATVAVAGALAAPWIARVLFTGTDDPATHDAQVRLGTIFLWYFLPQVVCYAAGLVATSVLNAHDRFALPAVAPLANNVVVITSCALFWWMVGGEPSLDLSGAEIFVLAGGTTLGVVAFCGLPVVAVWRSNFSIRPNLDRRHPEVRRLARRGAWAGLFLASTQVLLVVVLVLGNRVEGGVVAYQVAFQFFLLPYALFALPVLTALFPTLSRLHATGDGQGFAAAVERGVRAVAFLVLPAAALLGALSHVIARTVLFGATTPAGVEHVADALVGFAPGLIGYSLLLFASRVSYAQGNTRTPALVNLGVVLVGSVAMVVAFAAVPDEYRIGALAAAHSVAYLLGAAVLLRLSVASIHRDHRPSFLPAVGGPAVAAVVVATVVAAATTRIDSSGRLAGLVTIAGLGLGGLLGYLLLTWSLGGMRAGELAESLRSGP